MNTLTRYSISAIERETGLSKDVLRKWESRYGFPLPERGDKGERLYSAEQLIRLRLIKRLIDRGFRPASIIALEPPALEALTPGYPASYAENSKEAFCEEIVKALRRHDIAGLRQSLWAMLFRQGLETFVLDTISALNNAVGEAWACGKVHTFEEHLYTEVVQRLLREGMTAFARDEGQSCILLTTPPGELHTLGILMVEAILSLHGPRCIFLGAQTPVLELVAAAFAFRADIVALSFSIAYPARLIAPLLLELRAQLPKEIEVWAGGGGTTRLGKPPAGIEVVGALEGVIAKLAEFNQRNPHGLKGMY